MVQSRVRSFTLKTAQVAVQRMFQYLGNVGAPALELGERRREVTCPVVASLSVPQGRGGAGAPTLADVGPGYVVVTGS